MITFDDVVQVYPGGSTARRQARATALELLDRVGLAAEFAGR